MRDLRDVQSLASLRSFSRLVLEDNEVLQSFEGPVPSSELEFVSVDNNPALRSLGPTWPTTAVFENVVLRRSGLSDVQAFSNVESIGGQLELTQMRVIGDLSGNGNVALRSMPDFDDVQDLRSLRIRGSSLQAIPAFPSVVEADLVLVDNNDSITSFDAFPNLRTVDTFRLSANSELQSLQLDQLREGGMLDVSCNPNLPPQSWEPLREVTAQQTILSGNLGSDEACP